MANKLQTLRRDEIARQNESYAVMRAATNDSFGGKIKQLLTEKFATYEKLIANREEVTEEVRRINQDYVKATEDVLNQDALDFLVAHSMIAVPTLTSVIAGWELAKASRAEKLNEARQLEVEALNQELNNDLIIQKAENERYAALIGQQEDLRKEAIREINLEQSNMYGATIADMKASGTGGDSDSAMLSRWAALKSGEGATSGEGAVSDTLTISQLISEDGVLDNRLVDAINTSRVRSGLNPVLGYGDTVEDLTPVQRAMVTENPGITLEQFINERPATQGVNAQQTQQTSAQQNQQAQQTQQTSAQQAQQTSARRPIPSLDNLSESNERRSEITPRYSSDIMRGSELRNQLSNAGGGESQFTSDEVLSAVKKIYQKDELTDEEVSNAINKWPVIVNANIMDERKRLSEQSPVVDKILSDEPVDPSEVNVATPLSPEAIQAVNIERKNNDEELLEVNATANQLSESEVEMLARDGMVEGVDVVDIDTTDERMGSREQEAEQLSLGEMQLVNEFLRQHPDNPPTLVGETPYGQLAGEMKALVDDYRNSGSPTTRTNLEVREFIKNTTGIEDDAIIDNVFNTVDNDTFGMLKRGEIAVDDLAEGQLAQLTQDITTVANTPVESPAQFNDEVMAVLNARNESGENVDVDELRQQLVGLDIPIESLTVDELIKLLDGDNA